MSSMILSSARRSLFEADGVDARDAVQVTTQSLLVGLAAEHGDGPFVEGHGLAWG